MKRLPIGITTKLRIVEHVIARLGKDGPRNDRRYLRDIKEWCADLDRRGLGQWARQYREVAAKKAGQL